MTDRQRRDWAKNDTWLSDVLFRSENNNAAARVKQAVDNVNRDIKRLQIRVGGRAYCPVSVKRLLADIEAKNNKIQKSILYKVMGIHPSQILKAQTYDY